MDKKRKQIIEGFPEADAQKIIKRIQEQNRRLRIHRQKKVTPDKPYYSSKKLGSRFESRLPSALVKKTLKNIHHLVNIRLRQDCLKALMK